jgi:uncharacterized protein YdhG (YjbR/CyaY superfamily)
MSEQVSLYDEHLEHYEGAQRAALARTIEVARAALPGAVEVMAWGMPTFRAGSDDGPNVLSVTGFTRHNSLFPHSGSLSTALAAELADYSVSKGTIHFDRDRPFPTTLLRRILNERIREINESYPRKSGEYRQYYDTGFLKVRGRMKGDERAGVWLEYRRDGSLLREVDHRGR